MYQFSFGLRLDGAPAGWRCTEWILFPNQGQFGRGLRSCWLSAWNQQHSSSRPPLRAEEPLSAFCFTSSAEFTWRSGPAPWCCIQCNTSCIEKPLCAQGLKQRRRKTYDNGTIFIPLCTPPNGFIYPIIRHHWFFFTSHSIQINTINKCKIFNFICNITYFTFV